MRKVHRFFVAADLSGDVATIKDDDVVHQMFHVLKFAPGEEVMLLDGKGMEALCRITDISKKGMTCDIVSREHPRRDSQRKVTLYVAMFKRDAFEWAVQKAVEAGVAAIVPLVTRRTVKNELKPERIRTILKEAAEQCGRVTVPDLHEARRFEECLPDLRQAAAAKRAVNLFFDTGETSFDALRDRFIGDAEMNVFIGPEGGWDPEERLAAEGAGLSITSLGPLVLRAETAVAVAVYLAAHG